MLQESRACIITDISGIKKELVAKKPTEENRKKISRSISRLDCKKLKNLYEAK